MYSLHYPPSRHSYCSRSWGMWHYFWAWSANGKSLMNRKMRDVKEVLCVKNNASTAKQEHNINAEEAAEEAELWLSATSLLSALSEASPMTLSPSSSFNASNRSWCSYNLSVTEKNKACLQIGDSIQSKKRQNKRRTPVLQLSVVVTQQPHLFSV